MKDSRQMINRIFAAFFAVLVLLFMYYLVTAGMAVPVIDAISNLVGSRLLATIIFYSTLTLGLPLIVAGLFVEVFKPSFDFTMNKDKRWLIMSIALFSVVVLNSGYWWIAFGIPDWLPLGFGVALKEWVFGNLAMETSSLSLLFGILFLTKTVPQKSLSYKIILIGTLLLELSIFGLYVQSASGGFIGENISGGLENYQDFWNYSIFQPWFWLDFISEIVIFAGAVWLLWKARLKPVERALLIIAGLVYLFVPVLFIPTI